MALTKPTNQAIQDAIDVLVSQGRDVTTAAILSWLNSEGITAKASDVHDSAAWKELLAKEKGKTEPATAKDLPAKDKSKAEPAAGQPKKTKSAGPATSTTTTKTKETAMPKTAKKPNFPSKPCPKCGKFIHIRVKKHDDCGWVESANGAAAPAAPAAPAAAAAKHTGGGKKKLGRPKKVHAATKAGGITVEDIQAVQKLVNAIGAAKVRDLAAILS